jgi:hypothetical protein
MLRSLAQFRKTLQHAVGPFAQFSKSNLAILLTFASIKIKKKVVFFLFFLHFSSDLQPNLGGPLCHYAWPSGEVFRDYIYLFAEIYFVYEFFFNPPDIPFSVPEK